jgi:hypothetical protein
MYGMTQNKLLQTRTRRHQKERKQLAKNVTGKIMGKEKI